MERLPKGIEECRFVRLISREGYETSHLKPIVPPRRKRNCYRLDEQIMYVEMTRGRSDIYDILTHLTFLYIESRKIQQNSTDPKGKISSNWKMLEEFVKKEKLGEELELESAAAYLSHIIGRTYEETLHAVQKFAESSNSNSLFSIVYHLGKLSMEESIQGLDREIKFLSHPSRAGRPSRLWGTLGQSNQGSLIGSKTNPPSYSHHLCQYA